MKLTRPEREQLAALFNCAPSEVAARLKKYGDASLEEYVRMILGQRVFSRGQDIREYRLLLLIKFVFEGRLPEERAISAHFQTSTNQSRGLLRSVMSKYQYELQLPIRETLKGAVETAVPSPSGDAWNLTIDSENVIDGLNREIAAIDGTLPQVAKARGTVSTYEIPQSSYSRLRERYGLHT
jgi:hypothetical protein